MNAADNRLIDLPTAQIKARHEDLNKKMLRRDVQSPLEEYGLSIVKAEDWVILEQPPKTLPRALTELISLKLRDEGNTLIEATRELNNRYAGYTIRALNALLEADLDLHDLKRRVLVWAEAIVKEVLFKRRRLAVEDPYMLYRKIFDSFICEIDQKIAHGDTHMYSMVWARAMDAIPFWLIEALFIKTGLLEIGHEEGELHRPTMGGSLFGRWPMARFDMPNQLSLYGVEAHLYLRDVVLKPLVQAIHASDPLPPNDQIQRQVDIWLSDLLEAFPYLLSSKRVARHLFKIPGTSCVAAFGFLAGDGFARFLFSDSEDRLIRDLETATCRGILEIDYDGSLNCYMHPWLSLERMFDAQSSLVLTYWLLQQIHHNVVADYLKIKEYYLARPTKPELGEEADTETEYDLADYADWVREAQMSALADEEQNSVEQPGDDRAAQLPQMRRSRFFKLLGLCGVSVEQGKGSEIKLLKDKAHPFRLGNHYGPNPTIPSFLIASILKRLEITRGEWRQAVAAAGMIRL